MMKMKKGTAIAVAVGGWVAALGSAAVLSYDLNRPLHSRPPAAQVAPPSRPEPTEATEPTEPTAQPEQVLYMPTITIVGQARRPSAPGLN
jgi:hypothetical protein